jgi:hypothetical protein
MLPLYSTDRFWFAAMQANLSMALYFASLACDARQAGGVARRFWVGRVVSAACLLASGLAYEVFLPLFLLSPALIIFKSRFLENRSLQRSRLRFVLLCTNPLLLLAILLFKRLTTSRAKVGLGPWRILKSAAPASFDLTFGYYGINLPHVLHSIWTSSRGFFVLAPAFAISVILALYLIWIAKRSERWLPAAGSTSDNALRQFGSDWR